MKQIYFAGGCFWGTEHYLRQFEGVVDTVVGYANGSIPSPTYQQVYTDATGHAECVCVTYDPDIIALETLCSLFFRSIDPLMLNRQGDDIGTRYRTGIYWRDEEDREVVESVYARIQAKVGKPMAVEKCPLECFYPGEDYHQDYLVKNPEGYCHLSLETLKFAKTFACVSRSLRSASGVADEIRRIAKEYSKSSCDLIEALLESGRDEMKMCAHMMLEYKADCSPEATDDI